MVSDQKVFVNLDYSPEIASRLLDSKSDRAPKWFVSPLEFAGYEVCYCRNPSIEVIKSFLRGVRPRLLCFNPSLAFLVVALLPLPMELYSLYQWRPFSRLGFLKRSAVNIILSRSKKIAVYEPVAARYLRRLFPRKEISQIGLFTDTDYFRAREVSDEDLEKYLFVPGDHLRNEELLGEIAIMTRMKILRVTRNKHVYREIKRLNAASIEVKFNVSYEELRRLYQDATYVLILSDSSEIPTGITTLFEALACNKHVIINGGKSCSMFGNSGCEPILKLPKRYSANEVFEAVSLLNRSIQPCKSYSNSSGRAYVEKECSITAVSEDWKRLFNEKH
ncbi:hypothetical protein [Haliea sp. E17]|uniref:hypothetical protein n=1 Tax=Haliea sp. E17 TaxID=3401576 RepID=UPI003AAB5763